MTSLAAAALFLLGVYFSLRTVAALFRVLDLWYTIRTAWPLALRGALGWSGTTLAIAALLPGRHRPAFLWGLAAFVAWYVAGVVLGRLALRRLAARRLAR